MRPRSDEGSATVWTLSVALVLLSFVYAALLVCLAIGARHRAEAAADLVALAAAAAAQRNGDGCGAAARVAAVNAARLTRCVVLADRSVVVDVELGLPRGLSRWGPAAIHATARAGS